MADLISSDKADKKKRKGEDFPGYKIFERKVVSKHISIYLSDGITEASTFIDMIHRIKTATENDVITIHLNTPGGYLETGVQIINAIRSTEAHVITSLESTAYSLGTLIFLAGDELQIHENCLMMFHHYSSGIYGKGHEITAELEMTNKWFNKMMKKYCSPFLTDEELDEIQSGRDLWMDTDDIRRRLNRMTKDEQIEKKPVRKKAK
jgi:ATP-dependent Clp protease, protease subunit